MLILSESGWKNLDSGEHNVASDIRIQYGKRKDGSEYWNITDSEYGIKFTKSSIVCRYETDGFTIETVGGRSISLPGDYRVATSDGPKLVSDLQPKDSILISLAATPYSCPTNDQWLEGSGFGISFCNSRVDNDLSDLHLFNKDYKLGAISGIANEAGHVDYNEKSRSLSFRITSPNKAALTNLMLILQELGYFSKIYHMNHGCYRLVIGGLKNARAFINNCRQDGKLGKFASAINSLTDRFSTKSYDDVLTISKTDSCLSLVTNNPSKNLSLNGLVILV